MLLNDWKKYKDTIKEDQPADFFERYVGGCCNIDTAYRKFIYSFDRMANKEWFVELEEMIENTYINGYMNALSIKWSSSIESLQEYWGIGSVNYQWEFYQHWIEPHVQKGERVFVIISDGLRYEAAREFAKILNTERRGSTEISAVQGVLPSYTKLGMASLLPHRNIEISSDYGISVDGISIEGTENRNKILNKYVEKSTAVQYKDIVDLARNDLRKLLSGKDLIYIYQNSIDARGDHHLTEREVFDAIEDSFEQLKLLIKKLVNDITATNIYLVSDHGFIYQRGDITQSEKTSKDEIEGSYTNRRFILTDKDEQIEGTLNFDMKYLIREIPHSNVLHQEGQTGLRFKAQVPTMFMEAPHFRK